MKGSYTPLRGEQGLKVSSALKQIRMKVALWQNACLNF